MKLNLSLRAEFEEQMWEIASAFLLLKNNTDRRKCFKNVKSYTLVFLSEVFESLCEVFRKEEEVFWDGLYTLRKMCIYIGQKMSRSLFIYIDVWADVFI